MCTMFKIDEVKPYQEASRETSSTPLCNIGLNRRVKGNGTLAVKSKENLYSVFVQHHQPSSIYTFSVISF